MFKKLLLFLSLALLAPAKAKLDEKKPSWSSFIAKRNEFKELHAAARKKQEELFAATREKRLESHKKGEDALFSAAQLQAEEQVKATLSVVKKLKTTEVKPSDLYDETLNPWSRISQYHTAFWFFIRQIPERTRLAIQSLKKTREKKPSQSTAPIAAGQNEVSSTESLEAESSDQNQNDGDSAIEKKLQKISALEKELQNINDQLLGDKTDSANATKKAQQTVTRPTPQKRTSFWYFFRNKNTSQSDAYGRYGYNNFNYQEGTYNDELCAQESPIDPEVYFTYRENFKEYVKPTDPIVVDNIFKPIYSKGGVQSTYWSREMSSWFNLPEEDLNLKTFLSHSCLIHLFAASMTIYKQFFRNHYNQSRLYQRINRTTLPIKTDSPQAETMTKECIFMLVSTCFLAITQYLASHMALAGGPIAGLKSAIWNNPYIYYGFIGGLSTLFLTKKVSPRADQFINYSGSILLNKIPAQYLPRQSIRNSFHTLVKSFFISGLCLLPLSISLGKIISSEKDLSVQITKELAEHPLAIGPKVGTSIPRDMQGHQYIMIRDGSNIQKNTIWFVRSLSTHTIQILSLASLNAMHQGTSELQFKILGDIACLALSCVANLFKILFSRFMEKEARPSLFVRVSDLAYLTPKTRDQLLSAARTEKLYSIISHSLFTSLSLANIIAISKEVPGAYKVIQQFLLHAQNPITDEGVTRLLSLLGVQNDVSSIDLSFIQNALRNVEPLINKTETFNPVLSTKEQAAYLAYHRILKAAKSSLTPAEHTHADKPLEGEKLKLLVEHCRDLTRANPTSQKKALQDLIAEL
ncbi:hypothetical protein FJ366_00285 [Candidatus Dependentiae bacterium]|nr:hypothetical protein [Candidatus Dependentiae bacterium]